MTVSFFLVFILLPPLRVKGGTIIPKWT